MRPGPARTAGVPGGATGTGGPLPAGRGSRRPAHARPPVQDASSRRFLARATLLSAALSIAGAVLGLGRDQTLAHLFGAGAETDAFLVAWTVPEVAATLLIEDGMAFVLVPAFSAALALRARGQRTPDPVRSLVAASLPRLCLALAATAAVLAAGAPMLVSALAPGLSDPSLAVSCTRLTATCVLSFGLAGYCSAALRAHRSYLAPGAIYIVYNVAIIATMFVLGTHWGVRSTALGVALGGCLMVAVQAPTLARRIAGRAGRRALVDDGGDGARPLAPALVCAVLLFALCRQSQVLIERYLASELPAGAISHLNYAQKIAQLPMSLASMVCVVTFPVVAQAIAEGDTRRARDRVERDLVLMSTTVLMGAAVVLACAPQIVQLLFQRGAFTAQDTAATAAVMRVYATGLLGQTLVGALVRSYFATGRTTWFPLGAMGVGALATVAIGACAVGPWGAYGIAAANAIGITVTALLLLHGLGPSTVPVRVRRVLGDLVGPLCAAAGATGAGLLGAGLFASPAASVAVCGLCVSAVFLLLAWLLDAAGARSLLLSAVHVLRPYVTRKLGHGR
ncbi:murein biosynthesis protein MurJ [Streptomyces spinosirectus]|uniref:lipid II flippase MurJ n=1 Tax=Streptomyces TaxID=1883 RepID=UPI000D36DAB4|nr:MULTISPECIES: lipid II flippase MurJ [Streptomyces]MBY8342446.1 murein biosynthesis protein MurJ [Streptomyces plumbidurans]PTM88358.1 putative peptidoglycan lipid II flippase [Streptomyces sp. VMFN-G11Ma]UIR18301.1 murein biosynthesis protein MurJ [Streptomyces spinosirectus]